MTGEMNSVFENSPGTAELAAQMVPDLQNAYAYMSGIVVGLIVCCMTIQLVLAGHKAEKQGLVTLILTTSGSMLRYCGIMLGNSDQHHRMAGSGSLGFPVILRIVTKTG